MKNNYNFKSFSEEWGAALREESQRLSFLTLRELEVYIACTMWYDRMTKGEPLSYMPEFLRSEIGMDDTLIDMVMRVNTPEAINKVLEHFVILSTSREDEVGGCYASAHPMEAFFHQLLNQTAERVELLSELERSPSVPRADESSDIDEINERKIREKCLGSDFSDIDNPPWM